MNLALVVARLGNGDDDKPDDESDVTRDMIPPEDIEGFNDDDAETELADSPRYKKLTDSPRSPILAWGDDPELAAAHAHVGEPKTNDDGLGDGGPGTSNGKRESGRILNERPVKQSRVESDGSTGSEDRRLTDLATQRREQPEKETSDDEEDAFPDEPRFTEEQLAQVTGRMNQAYEFLKRHHRIQLDYFDEERPEVFVIPEEFIRTASDIHDLENKCLEELLGFITKLGNNEGGSTYLQNSVDAMNTMRAVLRPLTGPEQALLENVVAHPDLVVYLQNHDVESVRALISDFILTTGRPRIELKSGDDFSDNEKPYTTPEPLEVNLQSILDHILHRDDPFYVDERASVSSDASESEDNHPRGNLDTLDEDF